MDITLLITGGTIDKTYHPLKGELGFDTSISQLPNMIEQANLSDTITCHQLFLIDSLEMTQQHRETLLKQCQNIECDKILISHGTDTMAETAVFLDQHIRDKTLVLFGAMIPYALKGSDALFNLGTALAHVQQQPVGCYVSMNGRIFAADSVSKNTDKGVFETK